MNVNTLNAVQMAFYVPSSNSLYAWAKQHNGEWVTQNGSASLDAVRRIYPDTVLVTEAAALEMQNAGYRRPWQETTEEYYVSQLEMLSLMDWCRGFGGESFKSMDFTGADVTAIFVRYGDRFFWCHDLHTLTHRDLIGEVINQFCLGDVLNSGH